MFISLKGMHEVRRMVTTLRKMFMNRLFSKMFGFCTNNRTGFKSCGMDIDFSCISRILNQNDKICINR